MVPVPMIVSVGLMPASVVARMPVAKVMSMMTGASLVVSAATVEKSQRGHCSETDNSDNEE